MDDGRGTKGRFVIANLRGYKPEKDGDGRRTIRNNSFVKMKRAYLILVVTLLSSFVVTGSARAGSIAPPLSSATYPVKGEAELARDYGGTTYKVYIDWVVYGPTQTPLGIHNIASDWYVAQGSIDVNATGNYIYLYQLENVNLYGNGVDQFVIQPMNAGNTTGIGKIIGHDLDGTPQIPHHSLTGENKPTNTLATPDTVYSATLDAALGKVDVNFKSGDDNGVPIGSETETMWLVSSFGPQYSPAFANNGIPHNLEGYTPAPAPEPSSILLFSFGLLGLGGGLLGKKRLEG